MWAIGFTPQSAAVLAFRFTENAKRLV